MKPEILHLHFTSNCVKEKIEERKMKSGEGKTVCVTGASGYIASWLVKLILLHGYTVHATVRDLDDPKRVDHLLALEGAKERLRLFEADLMEDGSFDTAVNGCDGVFHTASPCFLVCHDKDPKVALIDPAVKGTLNVLNSCAKFHCVRRVVLTSSTAAMLINKRPVTLETKVDETWFSDPDLCIEEKNWYAASKIMAEEAAWKFTKEKDIDLVVICPGWVIGPLLQPTLNASCVPILNLIGAETYLDVANGWVHVKDVANAHILAFEIQSASGRYCLVDRDVHFSETVKILKDSYPTLQFPDKCGDEKPYFPSRKYNNWKARSLGIDFIPFDASVKEMIESYKEKQFI